MSTFRAFRFFTAAIAMAAAAWLAGCSAPAEPPSASPTTMLGARAVGLANPAATACVQAGGKLEVERSAAGERGICLLPGGLRCDEWAWFRKEAGACCSTNAPPSKDGIKPCGG